MSLLPSIKLRLAAPSELIDLGRIGALKNIDVTPRAVRIGAMTSHCAVATSPEIAAVLPTLRSLAGRIGDPQVRNRGTIGGSVANNDPAADYPAALLGLGATILTSEREISADDFFAGLFETALADDELLLGVRFPVPRRAAYQKFRVPGSRYALVGVFVAETDVGVRVAITGAGAGVYRHDAIETALGARFEPSSLADITIAHEGLNDDMHGSAEYRAHLIKVLTERAIAAALTSGG